MRQRLTATVLICLLLAASAPPTQATEGRSSGVDLSVGDLAFSYSTSADEGKYRMFSSNHPIPGFNRPASLYVIDAMVNVPIDLDVSIENQGTTPSPVTDIRLLVLHDEYQRFEIVNMTEPLNSVSGASSGTVKFQFTPTYAGNHSLQVNILSATPDDNPNNDQRNSRMTVGAVYWNCNTLQNWTATGEWSLSTDTSISFGTSCHVGNGDASTYSANSISRLTSPTLNFADGLTVGTRTMGLSFFYTGSVVAPDRVSVEARTSTGAWEELIGYSGTVDQDFLTDGASWNTFSIDSGGHVTPVIPLAPARHLHANSAFRWTLNTDANIQDIGLWMDEIVILYDQAARSEAYGVQVQGLGTTGAVPGAWGSVDLRILNDGNISTDIVPRVEGLPAGWDTYTTFMDGSSVPTSGFNLLPGTSMDVSVRIKPDANATVGLVPMTFNATTDHPDVHATGPVSFTVLADRLPVLQEPDSRPSCPAQQSCPFVVKLGNEGGASDVFDLSIDTSLLPTGWDVGFAWSQASSVLVRPGEEVELDLLLTVPAGAQPDTVHTSTLTATAQNDTTRSDTIDVDVAASMVTELSFAMSNGFAPVEAGSTTVMTVEVQNLADRPDILSITAELSDDTSGWTIESLSRASAVMTPGATVSVSITLRSPADLLASDVAPDVRLVMESDRSGMSVQSPWWVGPGVIEVRNVDMTADVVMLRLMPGAATGVHVNVTNLGNVDVELDLTLDGLPSAWSTWWRVSEENITMPVQLTTQEHADQPLSLELMLLAPTNAPAGSPVALGLRALDGSEEQARHDFEVLVLPVRKPGLELESTMTAVRAGDTVSINGTVMNLGNAPDSDVFIEVAVRSTQDLSEMVTFLSIDDGSGLALDTPHVIGLGTGSERIFQLDLQVPAAAPLGTRIVVEVKVQGGLDDENRPYTLEMSHLVEVDQRREVDVNWSVPTAQAPLGGSHQLSVEYASSSSFEENLSMTFSYPSAWAVVCDGIGALAPETAAYVSLEAGHIVTAERNIGCTVVQNGGPAMGEISVSVVTDDGVELVTTSTTLSWDAPVEPEGFNGTVIAFGGGGILLLVVGITVLLMRRKQDQHLEVDESVPTPTGPPVSTSGPPATSTGPPATVGQAVHPEPPASQHRGPALPATGLPEGWSMEQWEHYGHQWLAQQQTTDQ
ncbi:MAG: hypothetical protein VYB29_05870 [Candidatus Thermoplasmatota archaeon]|nr:hypothetical protein [Candidatus Thermoplasmatota archaeon]